LIGSTILLIGSSANSAEPEGGNIYRAHGAHRSGRWRTGVMPLVVALGMSPGHLDLAAGQGFVCPDNQMERKLLVETITGSVLGPRC
jgi:hypothetical protein